MVAVHGSGYCSSAFLAAKLILNNILRIAAVNTVGDALLWLGKVCLCDHYICEVHIEPE